MSPTAVRPTLIPALRRLWRDPERMQLGIDPRRAVVLELTHPACARVLDLLDGTRTEAAVCREAANTGVPAGDAARLLSALRTAGLVLDVDELRPAGLSEAARRRLATEAAAIALRWSLGSDRGDHAAASGPEPSEQLPAGTGAVPIDLREAGSVSPSGGQPASAASPAAVLLRRQAARVLVTGASQLAVPIASALASAGVGRPWPDVTGVVRLADTAPGGLLPTDAYRPRSLAAVEAVRRVAPDADLSPVRPAEATLAVLVGPAAPATLTALALGTRRLTHLAVTVRDGVVVIGPLVLPGRTPCLNCLDLHRCDRDPDWPRMAAQLTTGPDAEPVAAITAMAGVAYAAAEVLRQIDGGTPHTLAATIELDGPGRCRRRRWTVHPACGCLAAPTSRRRAAGEPRAGCFN
jgi:bacteriocin biosynthesis cyclodehydratase domain-containing protein